VTNSPPPRNPIRATEDHLRFLLNELNHRTQNTLATVLAIAGQTLRGMTDEETIAILDGRILALSKVHGLLGAVDWDKVGLRDVLDEILRSFGLADRISFECDEVRLSPKALLSLAMVFHELAANAAVRRHPGSRPVTTREPIHPAAPFFL